MRELPLVSIITPSLNQGRFIEETILSVLNQDYPNIEYIINDGGSTDKTLEILRKYGNKIKWISEPDGGQADAVNKGFRMAKGEILGWLNSDDTYLPGAIRKAVAFLLDHPEMVMVYGEGLYIDSEGEPVSWSAIHNKKTPISQDRKKKERYPTESFNMENLAKRCFICQPTVFLRSHIFKDIGPLDTELHTCMDYDYWIRIGKKFENRIAHIKECFANSRLHNQTKTLSLREQVYDEIMKTVKRHYGRVPFSWVFGYMREIFYKKYIARHQNRS